MIARLETLDTHLSAIIPQTNYLADLQRGDATAMLHHAFPFVNDPYEINLLKSLCAQVFLAELTPSQALDKWQEHVQHSIRFRHRTIPHVAYKDQLWTELLRHYTNTDATVLDTIRAYHYLYSPEFEPHHVKGYLGVDLTPPRPLPTPLPPHWTDHLTPINIGLLVLCALALVAVLYTAHLEHRIPW